MIDRPDTDWYPACSIFQLNSQPRAVNRVACEVSQSMAVESKADWPLTIGEATNLGWMAQLLLSEAMPACFSLGDDDRSHSETRRPVLLTVAIQALVCHSHSS